MTFIVNKDANNVIIKKNVMINQLAPVVNNSSSLSTTPDTSSPNIINLALNGTQITTNANKLNSLDINIPGVAENNKILVTDSNRNISNINNISLNQITVNSNIINSSSFSNNSSSTLTNITNGISSANKALTTNSYNNISDIKTLSTNSLTINNDNTTITNTNDLYYNITNSSINTINNKITWNSIARSDELNLYVAVGSNETPNYNNTTSRVMTSVDGKNWNDSTSNTNNWTSVCWSSKLNLFVAVASSGTGNRVMTSSDGLTWTTRTSAVDNNWTSVCWAAELNLFVAVASSGTDNRVMTSSDGLTWVARTSAVDNNWTSVCWAAELNLFVAVASSGTSNRVMTSSDGLTWTVISNIENSAWISICWASQLSLFVAVSSSGNNNIMTSSNGITWNLISNQYKNSWKFVTWIPFYNIFIIVANFTYSNPIYLSNLNNSVLISADGVNWTSLNIKNKTFNCIGYSAKLKSVALLTNISNSNSDKLFKDWVRPNFNTPLTVGTYSIAGAKYIEELDKWFIGTVGGNIFSSQNGLVWNIYTHSGILSTKKITDFAYSPSLNLLIAISDNTSISSSIIYSSNGGSTWSNANVPTAINRMSIAWSPVLNIFVAVGSGNGFKSSDGINWTLAFTSGFSWTKVIWANNKFTACAPSNIVNSSDGINWTISNQGSIAFQSIAWSNTLSLYVGVTSTGIMAYTSTDAITWTSQTVSLFNQTLYDVIWIPELSIFATITYYAHLGRPAIYYSYDGINWNYYKINLQLTADKLIWSSKQGRLLIVSFESKINNLIMTRDIGINNSIIISDNFSNSKNKIVNLNKLTNSFTSYKSDVIYALNNWNVTSNSNNRTWNSIFWYSYNNSNYYMSTSNNEIYNSKDGIKWSLQYTSTNVINKFYSIPDSSLAIAITNNTNTLYNQDATTWVPYSNNLPSGNWIDITFSPELQRLVIIASSGTNYKKIYYSDDLSATWNISNDLTINSYQSICWCNDISLFIIISNSGTGNRVMTSSEGIEWSSVSYPNDYNWTSVCWSNALKLAVAVANSGTNNRIMTSSDGITWNSISSPADNDWKEVKWINSCNAFIAIANSGDSRLMYSFDGMNWKLVTLPQTKNFISFCINENYNYITLLGSDSSNNILNSYIFKSSEFNNLDTSRIYTNTSNNNLSINNKLLTLPTSQLEVYGGIDLLGDTSNFSLLPSSNGLNYGNKSINIANHNGSNLGLSINNNLILATANNINSLNTISGNASANKALILNSEKSIYNINNLYCNSITYNTSDISYGVAKPLEPLITNSNNSISNINNITTNQITINNKLVRCDNTNINFSNHLNNKLQFYQTFISSQVGSAMTGTLNKFRWFDGLNKFIGITATTASPNPIISSVDGTKWTLCNTLVSTYLLTDVAYSSSLNKLIAVNSSVSASILSSSDGITWIPSTITISSITYFPISIDWSPTLSLFIAVTNNGANNLLSSADGIIWNTISSNTSITTWSLIRWISELNAFIIIGPTNKIYTSTDGINWSLITLTTPFAAIVNSITYNLNTTKLVISGQGRVYNITIVNIANLTNSTIWTVYSNTNLLGTSASGITWLNYYSIYILTGTSSNLSPILYSYDLLTWNLYTSPYVFMNSLPTCMGAWSETLKTFVTVYLGTSSTGRFLIFKSTDLANDFSTVNTQYLSKYNNNSLQNGINSLNNWYTRNNPTNSVSNYNSWTSVCWSKELELYVAVGNTGTGDRIMTSINGKVWDIRNSAVNSNWTSVCWSGTLGLFVAVANTGIGDRVMTSSNGINWTYRISASDNNWTSVCWANELNLFIAVSSSGTNDRVMTSSDGINWISRITSTNNSWSSICWSPENNLLVAVSNSGTNNRVMTSSDGINWTAGTTPSNNDWTSVCWANYLNLFIAVSNSGSNRVMTSSDGITWISRTAAINNDWTSITYSNELRMLVAVASSGTNNRIMYSLDSITWKLINNTNNSNWSSICWSPEWANFVTVSSSGTIDGIMHNKFSYSTYKNAVIIDNNYIGIINSTLYRQFKLGYGTPVNTTALIALTKDEATKPSSGYWQVTSDMRMKKNIVDADLDICYNNIKNIRLVEFNFNNEFANANHIDSNKRLGWIAQEVEEYYPKSVYTSEFKNDNFDIADFKTLDNNQLIISLYGVAKKLINKIEVNETKIQYLKNKADSLKQFVDSLEIV
jgi:hypothetical protein